MINVDVIEKTETPVLWVNPEDARLVIAAVRNHFSLPEEAIRGKWNSSHKTCVIFLNKSYIARKYLPEVIGFCRGYMMGLKKTAF